jgi:DNA-binding response OmpR family regulator
MQDRDTPSTSSPSTQPPERRPLRVVVIDDERDTVHTLVALLREEGHDATGICDSRDALKAVQELEAEAAIIDIAMPGMTGWDVARAIRETLGEKRPLLIAVSGEYTNSADRLLGKIVGFDHYLKKPCDPDVLMALLAKV